MAGTRATLRDVAARAGVSISTASRVVRGDRSRPVEAATEERIRAAVRELRYRPNLAARSLARGEVGPGSQTREVGVVLGTTSYKFSDPFFSRVIEGIDAEILANRLHLRFVYSVADLADDGLMGEMVRPDVVGGLLGIALRANTLMHLAAAGVSPIVVVEGPEPVRGVDFVSCDKEGAMAQVMEHLWGLGYRHFAFLGPCGEERARRFRSWLALAGVPDAPVFDTHDGWDMEAGYAAMHTLLASPRDGRPSAVVAACDSLAIGALRAAREMNVRIPADVALVGFDNTMGAFTNPPLTTVLVEREQLGRLAVRRLIERQRHPDEPAVRIVEATQLVVRESCGVGLSHRGPQPASKPAAGAMQPGS
jgi:LacI family transcriptional regulator